MMSWPTSRLCGPLRLEAHLVDPTCDIDHRRSCVCVRRLWVQADDLYGVSAAKGDGRRRAIQAEVGVARPGAVETSPSQRAHGWTRSGPKDPWENLVLAETSEFWGSGHCNDGPDHAASRPEALAMWTRDAARTLDWSDIGTIAAAWNWADLAISIVNPLRRRDAVATDEGDSHHLEPSIRPGEVVDVPWRTPRRRRLVRSGAVSPWRSIRQEVCGSAVSWSRRTRRTSHGAASLFSDQLAPRHVVHVLVEHLGQHAEFGCLGPVVVDVEPVDRAGGRSWPSGTGNTDIRGCKSGSLP